MKKKSKGLPKAQFDFITPYLYELEGDYRKKFPDDHGLLFLSYVIEILIRSSAQVGSTAAAKDMTLFVHEVATKVLNEILIRSGENDD